MFNQVKLFSLFLYFAYVFAEVTILQTVQTIYDRTPKLRIKGSGFDAEDIHIELGSSTGQLRQDKDFILTKSEDGDGVILKLLTSRKWVEIGSRTPPIGLILSSVTVGESENNLLPNPVLIANVLGTPSVKESNEIIYQTATNTLILSGSGFAGAKKADLFFDPPLLKEIAYEVVSPFPLAGDEIQLRIRHNYEWRTEPGPLMLVGIDTGGGAIKLNGDDGIPVAEVQADLEAHGVEVTDTSENVAIYHDTTSITISGSGFNPDGTTLRFANGILGKGVNYTMTSVTPTSITLRLTPGSVWRKNVDNLPGYLTLLAVNAGAGFVAVGPTNAKKGVDIARVFERPNIHSSVDELFATHTHELHIKGTGFPTSMATPLLRFSPPLVEDRDYTVKVITRTDLEVTLMDGREWCSAPCELLVTGINARGDQNGWVNMPGDGVHVAQVVPDVDTGKTGGVEVYPTGQKVYQSALHEYIEISGRGFVDGMKFDFTPAISEGSDYTVTVNSGNKATLNLKDGKKWAKEAGFLVCKSVTVNGKNYPLAKGDGIRVAVVLEDPVVEESDENIHETQSKVVVIYGRGFTNVADVSVTLRPTVPGAYKVLSVTEDAIRLQLKPEYDWLPSFLSLSGTDKSVPLQVFTINTGAGDIPVIPPMTIGKIIQDREGVVCDDSCEFAFDGVCDDGSEDQMYYQYWEDGGYYMDDDIGGYYGEGQFATGEFYDDEYDMYDDYYMEDDTFAVSACLKGTDCTDCGGVDAIIDYNDLDDETEVCTNTCPYARDGQCDDPRGANYCILGTDCQDCGPVGADNFTISDDDGWWDDDDDYWNFDDQEFTEQVGGLEKNRHKAKVTQANQDVGAAAVFLTMLEGMVYTIGAIFAAAALYLIMRWYKGQRLPFMDVFNPDSAAMDLDTQPSRRMPITPDVIRT